MFKNQFNKSALQKFYPLLPHARIYLPKNIIERSKDVLVLKTSRQTTAEISYCVQITRLLLTRTLEYLSQLVFTTYRCTIKGYQEVKADEKNGVLYEEHLSKQVLKPYIKISNDVNIMIYLLMNIFSLQYGAGVMCW